MTGFEISNTQGRYGVLTLFQGVKIQIPVIYGSPAKDVTGWKADLDLAVDENTAPFCSFTVDNNRVAVGTTNGLFTFNLDASDSAAELTVTQGIFRMNVYEDGDADNKETVFYGDLIIIPKLP